MKFTCTGLELIKGLVVVEWEWGVFLLFWIFNFKLGFLEVSPVLVRSVESRGFDVGTWRTIVRSRAEKQYVSPSLNFKPLLLYMQTLKILCSPLCHPSGLGCARLRYVPHNHLRASIFTENFWFNLFYNEANAVRKLVYIRTIQSDRKLSRALLQPPSKKQPRENSA